jgi:hypothetical protein
MTISVMNFGCALRAKAITRRQAPNKLHSARLSALFLPRPARSPAAATFVDKYVYIPAEPFVNGDGDKFIYIYFLHTPPLHSSRAQLFFAIRYADRVTFGISPIEGGMT